MGEHQVQVFIATFDDEVQAGQVAKDFQTMAMEGSIRLVDAAVIVHGQDGKVHVHETADPSGKTLGAAGAVAGGIVGLIFPPSILASAAVGGGAGAIWGRLRDKGFKDEDLKEIGESMPPGSSAIIAIAEDRVVDRLVSGIEGYERIARHTLSSEAAVAIAAEVSDEAPAETADSAPAS